MENQTEQLEIELDDETSAIAEQLAQERGVTVEELLVQLLSEAVESGYFNNVDDVTVDDSAEL